jgi:hypothetical protein
MLPTPIKSVLQEGAPDAPVSRGWSRVQRKRAVRDTARKSVLAVSCLLLAASVGWALRPLFPATLPAQKADPLAAAKPARAGKPAALDSLVQQLPKVQARSVALQRPAPAPAPAAQPAVAPQPDVDVVAALLESVRDAYDAGNVARATVLLQEIGEKHEDDPRAGQALYVLGLIQLERNKDPQSAVDSFTHALELSPPPELVPTLWQALERARSLAESR